MHGVFVHSLRFCVPSLTVVEAGRLLSSALELGTEISCSKTQRQIVRAARCCERLGTPILRARQSFHLSAALDQGPFLPLAISTFEKSSDYSCPGFFFIFLFLQHGKDGKKGPNNCNSAALITPERLAENS